MFTTPSMADLERDQQWLWINEQNLLKKITNHIANNVQCLTITRQRESSNSDTNALFIIYSMKEDKTIFAPGGGGEEES